ncbi:hypothetical protein FVEG_14630 [Fusarium verticillioides 7600]|uniref:Uncharacterized protein n=1 Tax=Gibberella moniliformis (strain M3125 / FGSC 7600) TaxID=334819 RepID=W7LUB7_GIBM7|nr:hypothetical protein FVEG_14630 [Fusarium verticillioides 7600]EWG36157.1 hypothetical protein FVEG_14630 [Fusarium verticillioides 7600]RBQ98734.1 hypothetical protein FVER53263_20704 [Fusarium verticillioides]RBR13905.1 hypothetical protein FVER53590_25703 [Fusarium verticillioides]
MSNTDPSGSSSTNSGKLSANNISRKLNINSEKDCFDLLFQEMVALPEREPLAPSSGSSMASQLSLISQRSSATDSTTRTNVWIAKTVRAAMSDAISKP